MLLIMALLRYIKLRQLAFVAAGLVLLLLLLPNYWTRLTTLERVTAGTQQSGGDSSVRSRTTEGLAAWLAFQDHPVIGVGPGLFPAFSREYAAEMLATRGEAEAIADRPAAFENQRPVTLLGEEHLAVEREALLVARERPSAWLLSDDAAARLAAELLGIRAHGTIGLLIRATRRGRRTPADVITLPSCT
jgi:hypothetical protein